MRKRGIAADVPRLEHGKLHAVQLVLLCMSTRRHTAVRNGRAMKSKPVKDTDYTADERVTKGKFFAIGISALDCTGCGSCAQTYVRRERKLWRWQPAEDSVCRRSQQKRFDYLFNQVYREGEVPFKDRTP